jgi:thiol-disulfide isomerase/thioredoxin
MLFALSQARATEDANLAGRYYTRIVDEFAGTQYANIAKAWYGPDRNIIDGKPVPEFAFTSLDDSTATVTPDRLRGRIYLIDFWATWCSPCVHEMEKLHEAYQQYKDRGFTILSVSFDRKPEDVSEFRHKKWPMPWFNAFVAGGFASDTAKAFEVVGIPKPILVGKDGTIIASGVDLRREKLETTLRKTFETAGRD